MSEAIRDSVSEIVTGPATLLVYALTTIGVVLALVSGQDSETFNAYLDLVGQIDVLLAALVGGRAVAVGAKNLKK